MKTILMLLLLSGFAWGQVAVRTQTVMRFGDLERGLRSAGDLSARGAYLTDDFEERVCAEPGTPIPRSDWLQRPVQILSFSQEAVHDFGITAIYSAFASNETVNDAIVDVWKQVDGEWKLAVRYRCPATGNKPPGSLSKKY